MPPRRMTLFGFTMILDTLILALPTGWAGPRVEFILAVLLGVLTGVTWGKLCLEEDQDSGHP